MRLYLITLLAAAMLLAALPALASEDGAGYQARFRIAMQIGEEFYQQLAPDAERGDMPASDIRLDPVSGTLFYQGQQLRLDMSVGPMNTTMSSIIDRSTNTLYLVDHSSQTAWVVDLAVYEQQYADAGLPVLNPEQIFAHWEEVLTYLHSTPGVKAKDLGSKEIDERHCHGVSFSAQLEDILKADAVKLLPQLSPLSNLKGNYSGEFWLDEDLGLPLLMKENMLGVEFSWELSDIRQSQLSPALFMVPRGYKSKPLPLSDLPAQGI
jgi:hypothetical protein